MLLEEVISDPLCILCQSKPPMGFVQSNAAMYMIIVYTVGLYHLKSVRCDVAGDLFPATPEHVTFKEVVHIKINRPPPIMDGAMVQTLRWCATMVTRHQRSNPIEAQFFSDQLILNVRLMGH